MEFTKNIFTTGAFKETSRKVELEICSRLPSDPQRTIVEFGLGHGNITREILTSISPSSRLLAFEVKEEFCQYVENHIKDDRLEIVHDGAENLFEYVNGPVHGFVSSIPLTFFSREMSMQILRNAYQLLEPGCCYSQVLYSKVHLKKLREVFDEVEVERIVNIPMEYVYHCKKKKS